MLMIGIKMFFDEKKKKTPYRLHQNEAERGTDLDHSLSLPTNRRRVVELRTLFTLMTGTERERESNCRRSRYLINSLMFARTRLMTEANLR